MPSRFPDGTRVLTVPAKAGPPPVPALVMTLHVDGDRAWSVQGTWTYNPSNGTYFCDQVAATVQNDGSGQFSGAQGSPPNVSTYSGTWT